MTDDPLASFLDETCKDSHLRVEQDLGGGFVKLRSSEAEKRQAAQDIRSSEDVLIELLRNSRDAGARHIFISTQSSSGDRIITVIDDGAGVPDSMRERIFEPRVTSKLDTAHMDKWGMHGRGMALYSIIVNSRKAEVVASGTDQGTSISVDIDLHSLGERKDQSTFPRFEASGKTLSMRGPKNLLRITAEFSLEHRDLQVFLGSPAEIAATLYMMGSSLLSPSERAFRSDFDSVKLYRRLGYSHDPAELALLAGELGLIISERTARRIIDGQIQPIDTMLERIERESLPGASKAHGRPSSKGKARHGGKPKFSQEDMEEFSEAVNSAFASLARKYYLDDEAAQIKVKEDGIYITMPFSCR